jgi:hypothetical protein
MVVVMGVGFLSPLAAGSVVVGDLYVLRSGVGPHKADAPLVVDSDAVLPGAVAGQWFQSVAADDSKIVERLGRVESDTPMITESDFLICDALQSPLTRFFYGAKFLAIASIADFVRHPFAGGLCSCP